MKFENLGEMNKFLETHNSPKLSQEAAKNLNRLISDSEIEAVIKKAPDTKKPWARLIHSRILPKIEKTNSDSSQTMPKIPRRGKSPKFL